MHTVHGTPSLRESIPSSFSGKVFGVGLGRTATHSLNAALCQLGYHVCHQPPLLHPRHSIKQVLLHYDGATDSTVALCFQELYRQYPNSKFILTIRDRDSWLASCGKHFKPAVPIEETNTLRTRLYGAPSFERTTWTASAMRHFSTVMHFFSGSEKRRSQLLVMDIAGGLDGWVALCAFLHIPMPHHSLPNNTLTTFPNITTEESHLQSMEFVDSTKKIGLLYLLKGQYNKDQWKRRRCMLLQEKLYVYRRANTPLCEWEDVYDTRQVALGPLQWTSTVLGPLVTVELTGLCRLTRNKKPCGALRLGLRELERLKAWRTSFGKM